MTSPKVSEIQERVRTLKEKRNAVILVHNYQRPEVQDVADLIGDSLGLSESVQAMDADVVVFCGVDFMAESAKILNPEKTVLHPDPGARCPMAEMIDVEGLTMARRENANAAVVSYVNSSAEIKAESDVCCTSANAVKVINSLPQDDIIFVPDSNLGMYARRFVDGGKRVTLWPGYCPTHISITREDILRMKRAHPDAEVVAHPECVPGVLEVADAVRSTEGMVRYAGESRADEFIIATEREMTYRLKRIYPSKRFYPMERAVCPNMKKVTLQKVCWSLERLAPRVEIPESVRVRAYAPLRRMVDIGRGETG